MFDFDSMYRDIVIQILKLIAVSISLGIGICLLVSWLFTVQ